MSVFLAPMLCVGAHHEHAPRAMQRLACLTLISLTLISLTLISLTHQLGGASVKRHFRKRTSARTQD